MSTTIVQFQDFKPAKPRACGPVACGLGLATEKFFVKVFKALLPPSSPAVLDF